MRGTFLDTARAALDATTGRPAAPDDPPSPIPSGDPPVIRRLPRSVDYTHIKMIILSLPAPLTTLVWRGDPTADPLWEAFNRRSLRAIDRQLRRREATLAAHGPAEPATERALLQGLRQQWVLLCMREMNERASHERPRWMTVRRVDPTRFPPAFRPPGPPQLHVVMEVWKAGRRGPALIDQRTLLPTAPPWGDPKVPWFDPDEYHRACAALLRQHFADVLSRRCGRRWRSQYAPPGWPLVTKVAVPALFELLRPHYAVRSYQDRRQQGVAGHYAAQLRRDITEILHLELPLLAQDLTIARVTAAIQRHIARGRRRRRPAPPRAGRGRRRPGSA